MTQEYTFKRVESDGMSGGWPYCAHKRGSNWLCIATGKNAANVQRVRCTIDKASREYDVSNVSPGDALECGAEYTTSGGRNDHDRRYYSVAAIIKRGSVSYLALREHGTLAQAMRSRGTEHLPDAAELANIDVQLDAFIANEDE
ncbi:hypothetical protein [Azonexus hydrophilus]|uniref:Uncharacterized protein n=1 Tax=Azonexus hydrophilus TaxID=418702 RepID=A0ABZ2XFC3_9RHOO